MSRSEKLRGLVKDYDKRKKEKEIEESIKIEEKYMKLVLTKVNETHSELETYAKAGLTKKTVIAETPGDICGLRKTKCCILKQMVEQINASNDLDLPLKFRMDIPIDDRNYGDEYCDPGSCKVYFDWKT
jgi:hypothetical protein